MIPVSILVTGRHYHFTPFVTVAVAARLFREKDIQVITAHYSVLRTARISFHI